MKLKQLFCRHIYKEINRTYLNSFRYFKDYWNGRTEIAYDVDQYAIEEKCIKCNKTRYIAKEELK